MSSWEELDSELSRIVDEINGKAYLLTDSSELQLSPGQRLDPDSLSEISAGYRSLQAEFGDKFLRNGRCKRRICKLETSSFIAEPLHKIYLLMVLVDGAWCSEMEIWRVLEREHHHICSTIATLPPVGGGGRLLHQRLPLL